MTKTLYGAILLAGLFGGMPFVHADSICDDQETQKGRAQFKQAEELEKAGKLEEAFAKGSSRNNFCFDNSAKQREFETRVTRAGGKKAEDKGDLEKAYEWYTLLPEVNAAEADRIMRDYVKAKPADKRVLSKAMEHFKQRNSEADLKALRDLATRNLNNALGKEAEAYGKVTASHLTSVTAVGDSQKYLNDARDWLYFAPDKNDPVRARAVQRGDSAMANDSREWLRTALSYYSFADNKQKEQSVRAKARRLAEQHEKKGETRVAVDYYHIAGDDKRAEQIDKHREEVDAKAEEKRKQEFNKDTADLEKELDLE